MLTNCGVIFFVTIALIILYLCLSSRRNNLCIFISSVLSMIITFIIYSIFSRTNYIPNTFISIINNIYSWLLSTNSTDEKAIFGLGFFYAILYFVIFAICEIISHILISYKEFIRKKKKSYYVIKYILVFGNGISILIGEVIGSGEYAQGQKKGYFSLIFTLIIGITLGTILFIIAPWVVTLYTGVNVEAQRLAMYLIRFNAFYILICALNNALFFLMRSGGRTEIVLLFDSFYAFLIQIPGCIILLHFFKLDLVTFICIIYSLDIIKLIIGAGIVISKKWIKNLTLSESK